MLPKIPHALSSVMAMTFTVRVVSLSGKRYPVPGTKYLQYSPVLLEEFIVVMLEC